MSTVKDIRLKVIPSKLANRFVKKWHYSGKVVPNSQLHFGAFLDGKLHGVMQYGNSIDKNKTINLVDTGLNKNEGWNSYLELNRMAFDDYLPKNSESRCISISIKLLQKNAPQVKWILSYADATQCGDGAIYRASGFSLTGVKKNKTILEWNGTIVADKTLNNPNYKKKGITAGYAKKNGAKPLDGYQLRYIYLIDKSCKLTVPVIPFYKIDEVGAGMYKGEKISILERQTGQ